MTDTFISIHRLFQQEDTFGPLEKMASIWFDKIIMQTPGDKLIDYTLEMAKKAGALNDSHIKELKNICVSINSIHPEYRFLEKHYDHENQELVNAAIRITEEETRKQFPDAELGDYLHEVAWAGAGLIDTIAIWSVLNAESGCSFIPTDRESQVVNEIFSRIVPEKDFKAFSEVIDYRIPDIGNYSWDRVLELRSHPHLESFRSKISEVHNLVAVKDDKSVNEILREMEMDDMRKLIRLCDKDPFIFPRNLLSAQPK